MRTPASRSPRPQGSILVVALIAMGVLALIATAALYSIGNRHAVSYHSQSWNDALASAEVGTDVALAAMNASIADPSTAWAAWSPGDATTFPKTWTPAIPPHAGEGNVQVHAQVTVDDAIADSNGERWFRVRSMGVAEVVGTQRRGNEPAVLDSSGQKNHRSMLRKARFSNDLTGGALRLPQVARTVEVMAGALNVRKLTRALAVRSAITLTGSTSIDSFDSTDATKSASGIYDSAKRQDHADLATNSSGDLSDLNSCEVRGSAYTNGGSIRDPGGVVGPIFDNFSISIPSVTTPVWSVINVTPNSINDPSGGMTLVGGPADSPQNYKISALTLTSSSRVLTLAPHTAGQESHVNIWVTGAMSITSAGKILQKPGVHVSIYCEGNVTIDGAGIVNQNNRAKFLRVFGVDPPSGTRTFTVTTSAGSGGGGDDDDDDDEGGGGTPANHFIGIIDAPEFNLTVSGTGTFVGAAIARTAAISCSGGFHYDESLADQKIGPPERYEYTSWIEDVR
jgi:Tfp pilus assembly protein PilX